MKTLPRGWIVALRPRKLARGPYAIAFDGACFAAREAAQRIANQIRRLNPHYTVRVVREGICK